MGFLFPLCMIDTDQFLISLVICGVNSGSFAMEVTLAYETDEF